MKKFAAALAATAAVGVVTAFAANPFSDVTPNDWAYQAVVQLKDAGIVNGFPNGTFQGQKDLTRFEMAQMVAKLMAHEDRANAEQQAIINKLANEFANELNSLGVKVNDLENKIGNVKVTGDARVRYTSERHAKSKFDYRARLGFGATVNDNTKVNVRMTTGNTEFGTGEKNTNAITFDRLNVVHNFGPVTGVLGRQGLVVGQGTFFDGTFDGVAAVGQVDKVTLTAGHGYLVSGDLVKKNVGRNVSAEALAKIEGAKYNVPVTLVQADAKVGVANVGGFYANVNAEKGNAVYGKVQHVYGFNAKAEMGRYAVNAEWFRNNEDHSATWTAGLSHGNYDQAKAGTFAVGLAYIHADEKAVSVDGGGDFGDNAYANYKGWHATADYALANNVGLNAYYNFAGKKVTTNEKTKDDNWQVALNYKF